MRTRQRFFRRRDERGVTIAVVALGMVALLIVVGLVIAGGNAFSNHRQVQNSSDASALAGATVLRAWLADESNSIDAAGIWTAVQANNTVNASSRSVASTLHCYIVTLPVVAGGVTTYPRLGDCSSYSGTNTSSTLSPLTAYGVEVVKGDTQPADFIQAAGAKPITAAARAIATVQAAVFTPPTIGSADIVVCAVATTDPRSGGTLGQVTAPDSRTPNAPISMLLSGSNTINPAAIGETYFIKGNAVKKTCGTNGDFKGLACNPSNPPAPCPPAAVPGYWDAATGNHSGPFRNTLATSCSPSVIGCTFALPLCYDASSGPPPAQALPLYCVTYGTFQITSTTANTDEALFTGQSFTVPGNGQGGGGIPLPGQAALIRLVL